MTIQHSIITDPNIHEPKGVATATSGKAYISDGAGSGTWQKVQLAMGACMKASSAAATTLVTTAYQVINNAILGGTITWAVNTNEGMTTSITDGYIQVPSTGIYHIGYVMSLVPSTATSIFRITLGVDSGAGIVSKETLVMSEIRTSSTADTYQMTLNCLPTLTADDKVYIMLLETSTGKEITIVSSNFVITKVT